MPEWLITLLITQTAAGLEGWAAVIATHALKAIVVLAAAALAALLMQRSSASARHLIWSGAFAAILLMPMAEFVMPAWSAATGGTVEVIMQEARAAERAAAPAHAGVSWASWLLVLWVAGAAIVIVRFAVGLRRVSRITRFAKPFDSDHVDSLRDQILPGRSVRVLRSCEISMPMTWGAIRPAILLPEQATGWSEERQRMTLAHELVHVSRHDWLVQAASQVVCAFHWFNPLVWFGARKLAEERERACDDGVLGAGAKGADYAGHLIEMVRCVNGRNSNLVEGVAMAQSYLEGRIRALLNPSIRRGSPNRKGAALVAAATMCLLLPLAAVKAPAQGSGTGRLAGTVRDASGGTVPRASVTVIHESGKRDIVTTSETGEFLLRGIPVGEYRIQVRKPGFAMLETGAIAVPAAEEVRLALTLNVGRIEERVDVRAVRDPSTRNPVAVSPSGKPVRIRVGGNVQPPKMLSRVNPEYPPAMKAQGIEGTVVLRTVISKAGVPLETEVLSTLAHADLVAAARDAVSQWRWAPTLLNGEPIEVITDITVNFTLTE